MSVTISGTTGVATPGVQNSASESITGNLTVGGNATITGNLQVAGVSTNLYPLVSGTALPYTAATNGGTTLDFAIPITATRITVILNGLDSAGITEPIVQIGTGGTPDNTGYLGSAMQVSTGNVTTGASFTAGFYFHRTSAYAYVGHVLLTLVNAATNTWVASGTYGSTSATVGGFMGGNKSLAGALNIVRVTTGSSTFTAGSANVMWE